MCGGVAFVDVVMCLSVVVEACVCASQGHCPLGHVSNIKKRADISLFKNPVW